MAAQNFQNAITQQKMVEKFWKKFLAFLQLPKIYVKKTVTFLTAFGEKIKNKVWKTHFSSSSQK